MSAGDLQKEAEGLAQRGEFEKALNAYRQCMELHEAAADLPAIAATMHGVAGILAAQGGMEQAFRIWREALAVLDDAGDPAGKPAILQGMAGALLRNGEATEPIRLFVEAAKILGSLRAYGDLVVALTNLSEADKPRTAQWLAQALWLARGIATPRSRLRSLLLSMYQLAPPGQRLEQNLIFRLAKVSAVEPGSTLADSPESGEVMDLAVIAASNAGATEETLQAWLEKLFAKDPATVSKEIDDDLADIAGDSWLFDRAGARP